MKMLLDNEYAMGVVKCPKVRLPEDKRKKIGITSGSDCLDRDDWKSFNKTLDRVLFKFEDPIIITMGKPNTSVDRLIHRYCNQNWLVYRVHHTNRSKPATVASELRLVDFLNDCDLLLVFQEGQCEKTEYIVTLALAQFLPVKIIEV